MWQEGGLFGWILGLGEDVVDFGLFWDWHSFLVSVLFVSVPCSFLPRVIITTSSNTFIIIILHPPSPAPSSFQFYHHRHRHMLFIVFHTSRLHHPSIHPLSNALSFESRVVLMPDSDLGSSNNNSHTYVYSSTSPPPYPPCL